MYSRRCAMRQPRPIGLPRPPGAVIRSTLRPSDPLVRWTVRWSLEGADE
jgi:hypothetical protein